MQQCLRQIVAVSAGALLVDVNTSARALTVPDGKLTLNKGWKYNDMVIGTEFDKGFARDTKEFVYYWSYYQSNRERLEELCLEKKDQKDCSEEKTLFEYDTFPATHSKSTEEAPKYGRLLDKYFPRWFLARPSVPKCEFDTETQECHVSVVWDQWELFKYFDRETAQRLAADHKKMLSSTLDDFKKKWDETVLRMKQAWESERQQKSKWSTGKKGCLCIIIVVTLIAAFLSAIIGYLYLSDSQSRCTNNADSEF